MFRKNVFRIPPQSEAFFAVELNSSTSMVSWHTRASCFGVLVAFLSLVFCSKIVKCLVRATFTARFASGVKGVCQPLKKCTHLGITLKIII